MLSHVTEQLRHLFRLQQLAILADDAPPPEHARSIPLRHLPYVLYLDAGTDWGTAFRLKALCEELAGCHHRIQTYQEQQNLLDKDLVEVLRKTDDFLSTEQETTYDFDFLPKEASWTLLREGRPLRNKEMEPATLAASRRRLDRMGEFAIPLAHGELFGYRSGTTDLIVSSPRRLPPLAKDIARIRTLWLDRLYRETKRFYLDPVTGLGTRGKLLDDLSRSGDNTLVMVNIDRFSSINRLYSQMVGDRMLQQVAARLRAFGDHCRAYRIYADRFALLSPVPDIPEQQVAQLQLLLTSEPYVISAPEVPMNLHLMPKMRVGVAVGDAHNILEQANLALQECWETRQRYVLYSPNRESQWERELRWVEHIRNAIDQECIVPLFQPIVTGCDATGPGLYEALMRIRRDGVLHGPGEFMAASRASGTYPTLQRLLMDRVFQFFARRPEQVSINLAAADLLQEDTLDYLEERAALHGMPLHRVVIEFVESEDMRAFPGTFTRFVARARELGMQIAVDDFGSGYSNFTYTQELAPDIIKLDMALIGRILTPSGRRTVQAVLEFARAMGARTVAEGIASAQIHDACLELGFDLYQGFHLGRPDEAP